MTKQAKILTDAQIKAALATVTDPSDRIMIVLSVKAGLRACEIAALTWPMVTDAEGALADAIALPDVATKGKSGGRQIPMHSDIAGELAKAAERTGYVVRNGWGQRTNGKAVAQRFKRLYRSLGFEGASSHSGRRTFITRLAHKITAAGGSIRDVQQLAGHKSLSMTQVYIEGNSEAKRRVVGMI
jgi:integrase/recombinase XerD